jgi:non-specific serine/threonine protein kinase
VKDDQLVANSLSNIANVASLVGDHSAAVRLHRDALDLRKRIEDEWGIANSLHNLGNAEWTSGHVAEAGRLFNASLQRYQQLGDQLGVGLLLHCISDVARARGHYDEAADYLERSFAIHHELGNAWGLSLVLDGFAAVLSARNRPVAGLRLVGASNALRAASGAARPPVDQKQLDNDLATARRALSDEARDAALSAGEAMTPDEALRYAQAELASASSAAALLSPREQEVALLIARGCSNKEIADAIVVSTRTAEGHVGRILNKLGLASRAQVAVWVAEHLAPVQVRSTPGDVDP